MENIEYINNNNNKLFTSFGKFGLTNVQNYIPIYNKLFDISENLYENINIKKKKNIYNIDISNNKIEVNSGNDNNKYEYFIKYSPLINPTKYLIGEYNLDTIKLPNKNEININKKILNENNASYVDSLFNFLSSKLSNYYNIDNCVDFYGSFLAFQDEFKINFFDDIDIYSESEYFYENKNKLFTVEKSLFENIFNNNTKKNKNKLIFLEDNYVEINIDNLQQNQVDNLKLNKMDMDDINDILYEDIFYKKKYENLEKSDNILELYNENNIKNESENETKNESENEMKNESESEIKNESESETENESESYSESESESYSESESESYSESETDGGMESELENENKEIKEDEITSDEYSETSSVDTDYINENFIIKIKKFPVQIICLEKLNYTLDLYLKKNNNIGEEEWASILFQIIIMLVIYQKCFKFTHNDLHTNNIMVKETDKKYLYYKYNNNIYKVPTFGKIYKIIDFGRSVYYYNKKLYCCDSFEKDEDAYTQFNFAHFYNNKKKLIEPNMSFDLCRLGCSLIEHIVDDFEEFKKLKKTNINYKKLIYSWLSDDKGKNILYKSDGEERYEDFDLYKKITRNVNNHIPSNEIKNKIFDDLIINENDINDINDNIIDIDKIEACF